MVPAQNFCIMNRFTGQQQSRANRLVLLVLFFFHTYGLYGFAEAQPAEFSGLPVPKLCHGYYPTTGRWGVIGPMYGQPDRYENPKEDNCPPNHAFVAAARSRSKQPEPRHAWVRGSCCLLPDDALTHDHSYDLHRCPDGYVATGARMPELPDAALAANPKAYISAWHRKDKLLRCTKINSERYRLGPKRPGLRLGWSIHFGTILEPRTTRARLPPGIRYGIGRAGRDLWVGGFCLGHPFGSLVVEKPQRRCGKTMFRELLYAGRPGDPAAGKPVKFFPDCITVDDPFSPEARCITADEYRLKTDPASAESSTPISRE